MLSPHCHLTWNTCHVTSWERPAFQPVKKKRKYLFAKDMYMYCNSLSNVLLEPTAKHHDMSQTNAASSKEVYNLVNS